MFANVYPNVPDVRIYPTLPYLIKTFSSQIRKLLPLEYLNFNEFVFIYHVYSHSKTINSDTDTGGRTCWLSWSNLKLVVFQTEISKATKVRHCTVFLYFKN